MEELGANTLRVYHVDPEANHDGCMETFADAGIYLLIDLDTFDTYIIPEDLFWNGTQYDRYSEVMDTFHSYDNVLGFFVGNENIAEKDDSIAAPFIKAAARDMKAYRDTKGYRSIPVGYSAADIKELRPMLQDYLTCGGNASESLDFFALNSYSWCDPSDYKASTYDMLQKYAEDFPVPIFFSETGCIVPGPRTWDDQDAIFSPPMINDWSGSIVYEWIQETNQYGIISYGPEVEDKAQNDETVFDGWTRKGTPTPVSPDFGNLKTKWASINPTGVRRDDYDPSHVSTRACPSATDDGWWAIKGNVQLPSLGESLTQGATFTSQASATNEPPEPTQSAEGTGDDTEEDDGENLATNDMKITMTGVALISLALILSIWL